LTHALPFLWKRARKATWGRYVQKNKFRMIKALSRKAGSRRAFSSGYKKGCAMKKTMPWFAVRLPYRARSDAASAERAYLGQVGASNRVFPGWAHDYFWNIAQSGLRRGGPWL
jgi:hypothetical protein